MPRFAYKSRNIEGRLVEGVLEGATAGDVADELLGRVLIPIEIHEATVSSAEADQKTPWLKPKILPVDTLLFSRQLHTLLRAGVPILRALHGLQETQTNPAMRHVMRDVRESLEGGRELSAGLARHPAVFSPFYLAMVKVGELTGRLDEVFLRLFRHLEFERYMREQVKAALRYPLFVILTMIAALVVVNIFVIPAFAKVFQSFGAQLPLPTRLLLGFSNFMVNWWPYLLTAMLGFIIMFRFWVSTAQGRHTWEAIALRLPVAGKILHKIALARFARSFSLAMRSGVPVVQALANAALTVDNSYISRRLESMREAIERGESIQRAALGIGIFTPVVLQMIAVGEESGAIDELTEEVGQMYQQEVEYELKTLSQQIEPILIIALGALVLILALGVFLPMWDLGKAAFKH